MQNISAYLPFTVADAVLAPAPRGDLPHPGGPGPADAANAISGVSDGGDVPAVRGLWAAIRGAACKLPGRAALLPHLPCQVRIIINFIDSLLVIGY